LAIQRADSSPTLITLFELRNLLLREPNGYSANAVYDKEHAASALGLIKDMRAFSPLLETLQSTDRIGVRAHVAYGLGLLGNKRAVEPLIKSLRDSSPSIRAHAAMALGLLGDKRALDALTDALKDPSKIVRREAALAREKILN
jgi:HEAT repeat protein